jgi:alkanesulfonate monooxygenase SsuD/methylene tetrahydromethanopterin reductase-like flavin-dependent oxidoreductase (luciferase family)
MLIANLSWRSPVLVARASAAIDQISGGRFELGVGAGAFADQAMADVLEMRPGERVARLAEGTEVIDRLPRSDVTPFAGRFTRYEAASMAPGCVQVPRPPITIAANGDGALRVAAQYADVWNTWGGLELPVDESVDATVDRSRRLEQYCADIGRDPSTVRRSLLVYLRFAAAWADEAGGGTRRAVPRGRLHGVRLLVAVEHSDASVRALRGQGHAKAAGLPPVPITP